MSFTGVRTTGIFCRPTCSAKKPRKENVDFIQPLGKHFLQDSGRASGAGLWSRRGPYRAGSTFS